MFNLICWSYMFPWELSRSVSKTAVEWHLTDMWFLKISLREELRQPWQELTACGTGSLMGGQRRGTFWLGGRGLPDQSAATSPHLLQPQLWGKQHVYNIQWATITEENTGSLTALGKSPISISPTNSSIKNPKRVTLSAANSPTVFL